MKQLINISIFSVIFFSSIVIFKEPFEFYLSYVPLILLLFIFLFKYKFPTQLFNIFIPLLLFGLFNIFFNNNTLGSFFKIYLNIFISLLFFYYVFEYYNRDVEKFFSLYMKWSVFVSVIGLIQLFSYFVHFKYGYDYSLLGFNKWGVTEGGLGIRVNSIFCEPSYVGSTLGPAFFISLYNLIFKKTYFISKLSGIVIILTYFLSTSSVAYLGVAIVLILFLINFGAIRYLFIILPIIIITGYYLFLNVKEFRARFTGVTELYFTDLLDKEGIARFGESENIKQSKKNYLLTKIHGSSFVQYNNFVIAKENFKQNPLFGTGLGSHQYAFEKYDISYKIGNIYDSNVADANSMFLRLMSETGLFGVIFIILFIRNFYVRKREDPKINELHWLISNAVLVIILLQLFRQGNYTFGGFMAFIWLYYYIKKDYDFELNKLEKTTDTIEENIPPNLIDVKPQDS